MSETRKRYWFRLAGRCVVFVLCCLLYALRREEFALRREEFAVLKGWSFFREFSVLHLLWLVWVIDTIQQIVPIKQKLPLGSMKLFASRFRPIRERINYEALHSYIVTTTKAAYKVFLIWCAGLAVIGGLYYSGVLGPAELFLISAAFYVCDLICVLIWCPFRLLMHTRCCTTCRIFNWDHLMMFTPMIFMGGFYAVSLLSLAFLAWLVWEVCIMMYPERFWDKSNAALKCSECTDKLCTQYCQKLRK